MNKCSIVFQCLDLSVGTKSPVRSPSGGSFAALVVIGRVKDISMKSRSIQKLKMALIMALTFLDSIVSLRDSSFGADSRWRISLTSAIAQSCAPITINVQDFGARADYGAENTDNTVPFQKALDSTIGKASACTPFIVFVPRGNYLFDPDRDHSWYFNMTCKGRMGYYSSGLCIPSFVTLQGLGQGVSNLWLANSNRTFASFLTIRNQDNVNIKHLTLVGNGVASVDSGSAIVVTLDKEKYYEDIGQNEYILGRPRTLENISITNVSLKNFTSYYWIRFQNFSENYEITSSQVSQNSFFSVPGNMWPNTQIQYPADAISIQGSTQHSKGKITNIRIEGNSIDARFLKRGISIWGGSESITVRANKIMDVGVGSQEFPVSMNSGAYGVLIYNNIGPSYGTGGGTRVNNIVVSENIITNPRSAGLYSASAEMLIVEKNRISGQTDRNQESLPKGAIALNHPVSAIVRNNYLDSNSYGLSFAQGNNGVITAYNNTIMNVPTNGAGIYIAAGKTYSVLQIYSSSITAQPGTSNNDGIFGFQQGGQSLQISDVAISDNLNYKLRFFNVSDDSKYDFVKNQFELRNYTVFSDIQRARSCRFMEADQSVVFSRVDTFFDPFVANKGCSDLPF
jgi:Right handed beta helix region